jgi:hypothetical protein
MVTQSYEAALAAFAEQEAALRSLLEGERPIPGEVTGIHFELADTLKQLNSGSDLWPVTESPDGVIYTIWGDGGGFGQTRRSIGFARLEGSPPGIGGRNLSFLPRGKSSGIVVLTQKLYSWVNTQDGDPPSRWLYRSDDQGKSWRPTDARYPGGQISPAAFVQYSQDNAPGGWVYLVAGAWAYGGPYHMARVSVAEIEDTAAYQWWTGSGWGPVSERQPFLENPGGAGSKHDAIHLQIFFSPGLKQYFATQWFGGPAHLRVLVAPGPWGPYRKVYETKSFGGMTNDRTEGLSMSFLQKWMSADGKTMWAIFSTWGPGARRGINADDKLNLVRVRVATRDGPPDDTPDGGDLSLTQSETAVTIASSLELSWQMVLDKTTGSILKLFVPSDSATSILGGHHWSELGVPYLGYDRFEHYPRQWKHTITKFEVTENTQSRVAIALAGHGGGRYTYTSQYVFTGTGVRIELEVTNGA